MRFGLLTKWSASAARARDASRQQRAEELGAIDSRNAGMSRNLVYAAADRFRYYAGWRAKIYGKSADMKTARTARMNI